ncbi:hypothetical protein [Edaphobacter albus]|uniref:hypothetical protein n=1 Tax=Edaphobacter sp. 4G125 TaxID=2763071 RepID=UPI0016469372|nr:hypothetical protein [Edaphobacter sp. 4G125]QNI35886.1 hypothetical protein H7846_12715 [Edaphobacter sp. 4G125]
MAKGHTLDRDQLYAEVWSEAMTKVSTRYGVSDVALAKICRRMDIPAPERGYWARVAAGQKLPRPPLPPRGQGVPQTVQADPGRGRTWASELKTAEITPAPVSGVLSSPHRFTLQLQKSFSLRSPDSYGRIGSSREDIDVKIAPSSIPRVLLFVDAFLKAAEDRGYSFVLPETEYERGLEIVIQRQRVKFTVFEEATRVVSKGTRSAQTTVEFHPSGRLSFRIREYLATRNEPTFSDRSKESLESQLGIILHGLRTAAAELAERTERFARKKEAEEKRADEHRRAQAQLKKLDEDVENWSKAEALHRLIAQVERRIESKPPAEAAYADRWLTWARTVATNLDPTSQGLNQFFEHYRKLGRPTSPHDLE